MVSPEENRPREIDLRNMISRDLEQTETGAQYRGPIKRISIQEYVDGEGNSYKIASVYVEWAAVFLTGRWVKHNEPEDPDMGHLMGSFNLSYSTFTENPDGTIHASIPYIGSMRILRKGDNLPKESVAGFEIV